MEFHLTNTHKSSDFKWSFCIWQVDVFSEKNFRGREKWSKDPAEFNITSK